MKIPYKVLHADLGIDWQKKEFISIYKHTGKFTFKSLSKKFNLNRDNINLLFITFIEWGRKQVKGVRLKGYDLAKYDIFVSKHGYRHFDTFYRKQEVENVRKRDDIEVCIVSINKQALGQVKEQQWSAWNLVKGAKYTDRITVKNEEIYVNNHREDLISYYDFKQVQDDLDKSGYSVLDKRRSLRETLEQRKIDELNKVKDEAFKEENAKIYTKLVFARELIIKELQEADTRDEIAKIVNKLEDLRSAFGSYERHLRRLNNIPLAKIKDYNKYNSIAEVEEELQNMNIYISEHFCKDILTNYAI